MAWLRLDDGFTKHPKFEGWTAAQRWAWLEVMEYCARYRTGGRIPVDLSLLPRAVTPTLLGRAEQAGWVHRGDDGELWISDWDDYNPGREGTNAERQQRYRERSKVKKAHAAVAEAITRGTLTRQPCVRCGSTSNVVAHHEDYAKPLDVIWLCRPHHAERHAEIVAEGVTSPVTDDVTSPVTQRETGGPSRARAPAPAFPSRPVPSLEEPAAAASHPVDEPAAAATRLRLEQLGLDIELPDHDLARAAAWLDLAQQEADTNPAGYVRRGLDTGAWPSPRARTDEPAPVDQPARRRRYVEANGWRLPPDELEYQLTEMGADEDELVGLLETAADLRHQVTA